MIPNENQWTIIFSKMHTAWGSFSYKEDEDALRVTVKPQADRDAQRADSTTSISFSPTRLSW